MKGLNDRHIPSFGFNGVSLVKVTNWKKKKKKKKKKKNIWYHVIVLTSRYHPARKHIAGLRGGVMSQYYSTCTWAKGYMIGAYRADTSMISAYRADACGS